MMPADCRPSFATHPSPSKHLQWSASIPWVFWGRRTFARHGLVFNCRRPVIRGHLLNADWGQTNPQSFCLLAGVRGQFASCEYPLNINLYSDSTDLTDLARNSPCVSARMVEAEQEAMRKHDLFFNTRDYSQVNNIDGWICRSFSAFVQRFRPIATTLAEKWHSKQKVLH